MKAMKKKTFLLLLVCLSASLLVHGQTRITGTVTDAQGKPLQGASVVIKGTTTGVITDAAGGYVLTLPEGAASLVFSFLGYVTVEKPALGAVVDAQLTEDSKLLGEVVVTALGITREQKSLGYATQEVSGSDLSRSPAASIAGSLSGKVAGLQITTANTLGGSTNVILRGFKSLTQSNQSLFVVDGVPVDNSNLSTNGLDLGNTIADLNPDDIESINVLKGAAASALYGSRAVNGVIVVNTKKGAKDAGLSVVFNQTLKTGWIDRNTLPKYQTEYGQGRDNFADAANGFYHQPAFNSGGNNVTIVKTNYDEAWGPAYDPNTLVYTWESFTPRSPNYGKATPWVAASHNAPTDYFETPFSTITSLILNGGAGKSTYKAGYTFDNTDGITPNSFIRKHNITLGWTQELAKRLRLGASLNYTSTAARNRSTYDYRAGNTNVRNLRQWLPSNIDYDAQKAAYDNGYNASWNMKNNAYNVQSDEVAPANYSNNPYWNDHENYNNDGRNRYFGNIRLDYEIIDGLHATARVSRDDYTHQFENRIAEGSIGTSWYYRSDIRYWENNYDLLFNYDKTWGAVSLKALLGGTIRQTHTETLSAETSGGLAIPGLYALSNSKSAAAAPKEFVGNKQVDSGFGEITINYKDLLTLDVTGRLDRSSTLPTDNDSYFYPAVSGGFIFSSLLPGVSWLTYGKLRANYAEVGSDAPYYSTRNTYVAALPFGGQYIYGVPATNNNPALKPERNKSYEVGLDLWLFDSKVKVDATYYHSRLSDQITPAAISSASGYEYFYVNSGTIQNQGVELSLNVTPVHTRHFSYDFTLNWSKNNNEVLSLYNDQPAYTITQYHNGVQLVAEVGKPYGILRGTDYEYLNGQRVVGSDGFYKKSTNTSSDLGKVTPDWIGGFSNRFRYGDFTLSFLIDASKGGNVYSLDIDNGSRSGILESTAGVNELGNPLRSPAANGGGLILPGVKEDGSPNTTRIDVANFSKRYFGSTYGQTAREYVYDASYVKLREVALAYSLPAKIFSKTRAIKGVTLSLTGRNLWIIYKNLPYADPEQGAPSTTQSGTTTANIAYNPNASLGYQNGVFPSVREIAFNIKLNF
jgi:TonB-linked SusC/RagA family outer membrane protein